MKPKIYTQRMLISFSVEQKSKIEQASIKEVTSMGELIRDAVMEKVNKILKENKEVNYG